MPEFKDLRSFHDDALKLPIGGVVYRVPSPAAAEALALRKEFFAAGDDIPDETHVELGLKALGSHLTELGSIEDGVGAQMYTDGCSWPEIMRAASTALLYIVLGEEFAQAYWAQEELDVTPPAPVKADPPKPATARKAPAKKAAPRKAPAKKV